MPKLGTETAGTQRTDSVPRLTDLCLTTLLSPRDPSGLPPLLDHYDWEGCNRGGTHPLLDPQVLKEYIPVPSLPPSDVARMLQCLNSAYVAATQSPKRRRLTEPFPRSYHAPPPDDASTNPYYYPCPSPRHNEWESGHQSPSPVKLERRLFLHAAEERFEWTEVFGEKDLPIQWLGCSPGCLAFLDEEDDFGFDELDLEES